MEGEGREGESGGRAPEKRERKKGEVVRGGDGLCGDGGVGGREYSFVQKYCLTKYEKQM